MPPPLSVGISPPSSVLAQGNSLSRLLLARSVFLGVASREERRRIHLNSMFRYHAPKFMEFVRHLGIRLQWLTTITSAME